MPITYVGAATDVLAVNNGGSGTLTYSNGVAGDCVVIALTLGTSRTTALSITSSAGTAYTQIVTTTNSSYARFGVFRRILPAVESQAIITGTGASSDSLAATAMVFRGVSTGTPEDVAATVTTGSGTTPDSPSISQLNSGCALISAFGAQITDAAVTAPSSFLNTLNANAVDTVDATTGSAWITSNSSPFDPTSWSGLTSASWVAATVVLRPLYVWSMPQPFRNPDFSKYDLVEY